MSLILHERPNSCKIKTIMDIVTLHHIRPGKEEQIFMEGFVSDDSHGLSTLTILSEEDSRSLTERLQAGGFIEPGETIRSLSKFYPRGEPFNLLVFRDHNGQTLGYYSDIAMPLQKVIDGYKIVDLFLDIWLKPDGTLLELDLDEFQDAIAKDLITEEQQTLAMTAFERLKGEVKQGLYPHKYIQTQ